MQMVLRHGHHLSQGLPLLVLLDEPVDTSQCSEQEEMVSIVHFSSKQEHESVSETRHQDIRLMSLVLETLSDFVFQQVHRVDLFSPVMPVVI